MSTRIEVQHYIILCLTCLEHWKFYNKSRANVRVTIFIITVELSIHRIWRTVISWNNRQRKILHAWIHYITLKTKNYKLVPVWKLQYWIKQTAALVHHNLKTIKTSVFFVFNFLVLSYITEYWVWKHDSTLFWSRITFEKCMILFVLIYLPK